MLQDREGRPTVSAVIPAYNAAETIGRALDSVYAQTYGGPIEIVVVDDGSEDDTADIVRTRYPDVKLVHQQNRGLAGARNTGVRAARHSVVAFLDSDDEWYPRKIEAQIEVLRRLPRHSALFTISAVVPEPGSGLRQKVALAKRRMSQRIRAGRGGSVNELTPTSIVRGTAACGASLMISRDTYALTGGYNESIRISEDYPFFLALAAEGARLYLLNRPLYRVHIRPDSLHRSAEAGGSVARIEAFERFDPRHSETGRKVFTQDEFDDAFQVRLLTEAIAHIDQGLVDEAQELVQRALALGDFDRMRTRALRVGLRSPRRLKLFVWILRRAGLLRL